MMAPARTRFPVLREVGRVAAVRPSPAAAVRAMVAIGVPLLTGHLLREPELTWAAIGGFIGAMVDQSGRYGARAGNLAAVTAGSAAAAVLGALLGHGSASAVLAMLVWGATASFLRVYGPVGINVGLTSSVTLAVSLAMPVGWAGALERGGWLLAGGGWAALLALAAWPLRPHVPARVAVARCYVALGGFAAHTAQLVRNGGAAAGPAGRGFEGVRQALEEGWRALGARWVRHPRRARRVDERLLILLESADQMLAALVALSDVAERLPIRSREALATALDAVAEHASALATTVQGNGRHPPPPPAWHALAAGEAGAGAELAVRHAGELLRTLHEFAAGAADALGGAPRATGLVPPPRAAGSGGGGWLAPIRSNLSADSLLLRHAVRVGVTAAVAVLIGRAGRLDHGYWIPLTVLFILQPYTGLTMVKGLQRVLGTVLGGVVAALIPLVVRDPLALLGLISLLGAAAVVTLPVNYALFALFVTPTFVLLAELQRGAWDLEGTRVLHTVIGGVLALAGARLLWSLPERRLFPAHVATALGAARAYLLATVNAADAPAAPLPALRRDLGLAIISVDESLGRLEIEEGGAAAALEPARVVLVCLRRLASAEIALAAAPLPAADAAVARRFADAAGHVLDTLAQAMTEQQSPPPLPPLIDGTCPPALRATLERVDRPIRVLHGAASRISGSARWAETGPASR